MTIRSHSWQEGSRSVYCIKNTCRISNRQRCEPMAFKTRELLKQHTEQVNQKSLLYQNGPSLKKGQKKHQLTGNLVLSEEGDIIAENLENKLPLLWFCSLNSHHVWSKKL